MDAFEPGLEQNVTAEPVRPLTGVSHPRLHSPPPVLVRDAVARGYGGPRSSRSNNPVVRSVANNDRFPTVEPPQAERHTRPRYNHERPKPTARAYSQRLTCFSRAFAPRRHGAVRTCIPGLKRIDIRLWSTYPHRATAAESPTPVRPGHDPQLPRATAGVTPTTRR